MCFIRHQLQKGIIRYSFYEYTCTTCICHGWFSHNNWLISHCRKLALIITCGSNANEKSVHAPKLYVNKFTTMTLFLCVCVVFIWSVRTKYPKLCNVIRARGEFCFKFHSAFHISLCLCVTICIISLLLI